MIQEPELVARDVGASAVRCRPRNSDRRVRQQAFLYCDDSHFSRCGRRDNLRVQGPFGPAVDVLGSQAEDVSGSRDDIRFRVRVAQVRRRVAHQILPDILVRSGVPVQLVGQDL